MSETVVSLSGGKDSTAMLLMMLERGEKVDEVIYFDTGWEFPEMAEHVAAVERLAGIKVARLHPDKPFDHYMFDHVRTRGKYKGKAGWGWARPRARWCTKIKTETIDKHLKGRDVVQCVGIAADELRRVRDLRYPLVEYGVTEKQALEYCYAHGFTWGGLYECMNRVSCWCCPLQGLRSLRALRRLHPELWQRLRDMDARSWNDFRIGCSVEQLERRFAREDAQISLF